MPEVRELARAKVNLDLCITGRRADGYHELDSIVVFAHLADRLTLGEDEGLSLAPQGPFAAALGTAADNLALRAARLLAAHAGRRPDVRITLEKRIPVAAGLGGGSADAAATLRGLVRLWQMAPDEVQLLRLAGELGADVPVCLRSRPTRMRGIGERLEPLTGLPELLLLLVNPGVAVPTAACFAALSGIPRPIAAPEPVDSGDLVGWLRLRANHLEAPAQRLAPAIGVVLQALQGQPGCRLARLSGSGATCFGVFEDAPALERAAAAIRGARPDWWVAATVAGGS